MLIALQCGQDMGGSSLDPVIACLTLRAGFMTFSPHHATGDGEGFSSWTASIVTMVLRVIRESRAAGYESCTVSFLFDCRRHLDRFAVRRCPKLPLECTGRL